MIKTFAHNGLEKFFKKGSKAGIQAAHEGRLQAQLAKLDASKTPQDMDLPAWKLHPLKGPLKSHWAVFVSGNWRLTFKFIGEDAEVVDYQDYHYNQPLATGCLVA
jgi:proteic killer suppression protein